MAKIFISYRREDSQYQADRLHTAIKPHVDDPARDIFIDIDNIPLGVNFATYLDGKVAECEVLLALIGPGWLEARDGAGNRRLDSPDDFVRIEIASALKRGIPVVPVLMDGAPVPRADQLPEDLKELALRNGTAISRSTFEADTVRMVKALGLVEPEPDPPARKKSRAPLIAVAAIAVIGAIIGGFALSQSQFWDAGESEWEPSDEASGVSEPTDTTLGNGDLYEVLGEDGALSPDIVSGESTVPGSAAGPFDDLFDDDGLQEGTLEEEALARKVGELPLVEMDSRSETENRVHEAVDNTRTAAPQTDSSEEPLDQEVAEVDTAAAIRDLQEALKRLGFYTDYVDGAFGENTSKGASALIRFHDLSTPAPRPTSPESITYFVEYINLNIELPPWAAGPSSQDYIREIVDLSELIGLIHSMKYICEGESNQYWRLFMIELVNYEAPDSDAQRRALVLAFNDGFFKGQEENPVCDSQVLRNESIYSRDGFDLAFRIRSKLGEQTDVTSDIDRDTQDFYTNLGLAFYSSISN